LFSFFPKSHFNRFFLSLHSVLSLLSVLSLHFLLKHETGLGFGLRLETLAWWWLTVWWLIGGLGLRSQRGGGLGLPILRISAWVCRSQPRLAFSLPSLFQLATERPTPLATPRRRDPPRWPCREGEIHPAGHATKDLTPLAKPSLAMPIPTVWRWWSRADLDLEEWVSA
jgi:hypothetical protein